MDPITTDVGIEFIEIDPTALRLMDELLDSEAPATDRRSRA
jgi:hypothetical protein